MERHGQRGPAFNRAHEPQPGSNQNLTRAPSRSVDRGLLARAMVEYRALSFRAPRFFRASRHCRPTQRIELMTPIVKNSGTSRAAIQKNGYGRRSTRNRPRPTVAAHAAGAPPFESGCPIGIPQREHDRPGQRRPASPDAAAVGVSINRGWRRPRVRRVHLVRKGSRRR